MTIHITPEPECSYVSFESNIPLTSYTGLIQRVLNTFNPGKFIMTVFANRVSGRKLLTSYRNILVNLKKFMKCTKNVFLSSAKYPS